MWWSERESYSLRGVHPALIKWLWGEVGVIDSLMTSWVRVRDPRRAQRCILSKRSLMGIASSDSAMPAEASLAGEETECAVKMSQALTER